MTDRLVLALDGSTRACAAALLRWRQPVGSGRSRAGSWEVLCRRKDVDDRGQAKVLLRLVDEMLGELGAAPQDLGVIVVGTGPGTFTGVRITVATARALSLALGAPVLGVSTLGALAAGAAATMRVAARAAGTAAAMMRGAASDTVPPRVLVPVVDARRGQVFFGLYEAAAEVKTDGIGVDDGLRRWARSTGFGVCDREALGTMVAGGALIVAEERALIGDLPAGVAFVAAEVEAERLVMGQELLDEPGEIPQGSRLTPWLVQVLTDPVSAAPGLMLPADGRAGHVGAPEAVKPIYVRSPDADIHITKMKDPWADASGRRDSPGGR